MWFHKAVCKREASAVTGGKTKDTVMFSRVREMNRTSITWCSGMRNIEWHLFVCHVDTKLHLDTLFRKVRKEALQHRSTTNRKMELRHLVIQTLVLYSCNAKLGRTRQSATEQTDDHYDVPCCSHGGLHCAVRALVPPANQWLVGACRPLDIWWWEVVCKVYYMLWDICRNLWP